MLQTRRPKRPKNCSRAHVHWQVCLHSDIENLLLLYSSGLSNCTIIKELYLAGNKISEVEGLHRLLKLTVLDLSFNKLTTAKALGQLVANYHSLLALNLLGNPIQSNIGDDQLRKTVSSLLPHLTYLNKQPIKPQRAREVVTDSVARAALGNSSWNSRKKASRRVTQGSSSSRSRINEVGHRSRHKSKSNHHGSPSTRKWLQTLLCIFNLFERHKMDLKFY